jgi:hypothetical protein
MSWLSRVRAQQGAAILALALIGLASACVVASPPPEGPPPPPPSSEGPGEPEPPYSSPEEPGDEPGYQPMDCSQRPSMACCKALTPECTGCMDRNRAMQEQWDRECAHSGPTQPAPGQPVVDCSQEPPGRMCCEAMSAECRACEREARAERAAWAEQCYGEEPPAAPSPPAVDCSQPPGRMCCQAENEYCRSCRREAAAERAAWQRECS